MRSPQAGDSSDYMQKRKKLGLLALERAGVENNLKKTPLT